MARVILMQELYQVSYKATVTWLIEANWEEFIKTNRSYQYETMNNWNE